MTSGAVTIALLGWRVAAAEAVRLPRLARPGGKPFEIAGTRLTRLMRDANRKDRLLIRLYPAGCREEYAAALRAPVCD